jgi:hypothetical protein
LAVAQAEPEEICAGNNKPTRQGEDCDSFAAAQPDAEMIVAEL